MKYLYYIYRNIIYFAAAFLALRSIVVVELFGLHRLTSTFGLLILFQGVASVIGAPLAGTNILFSPLFFYEKVTFVIVLSTPVFHVSSICFYK